MRLHAQIFSQCNSSPTGYLHANKATDVIVASLLQNMSDYKTASSILLE